MNRSFQLITRISIVSLTLGLLLGGCKKEYDSPPERILPIGQILTIQELRDLYQGNAVRFPEPYSVYCVVTADEQSGNLYRNIHVQDATGALVLRLNNPGGLYQGDSIRIYLPGTILNPFSGLMQLDSVDVDNNIIKQATQVYVAPELVTISQITPAMQGKLIKLENVEFANGDVCLTYSDAIGQTTQNRNLTNCTNNTVIVRTSGYANFANQPLPQGNGSIIAVVGQFNTTMQLYIRNINEVQLTGERCTPITCDGGGGGECEYDVQPVASASLDFSDVVSDDTDYSNPLWVNKANEGSRVWRGRIFQSTKYLRATSFGSNQTNEAWFISPPVTVAGPQLGLSFRSATAFWNDASWPHPLTVYVSTDFDGCDIDGATWQTITGYLAGTNATANYTFINSGTVNVTDFLPQGFTGNVHIAFVYNGQHPSGVTTTLDLDDIVIQ
jgi:hypothetical protein